MFHCVVLSVERGWIIFHRVALCVVWGCCFFRAGGGAGVCAGENSPCSACWQQKRDKTLPARAKRAKLGDFGRAGRVLYRNWHRVARVGRVLYRDWWRAGRAGRVLYRNRGPQLARGKCCADCPAAFGRRWVRSGHNKTARRVAGRGWSGRRESNPPLKLGKLPFYR